MGTVDLRKHAYALEASGYTILRRQLVLDTVERLREAAARALTRVRAAIASGHRVPFQTGTKHYEAASVLYCWSDVALSLLEEPTVLGFADLLLRDYRLNDLTVFSALPALSSEHQVATTSWHRDCQELGNPPGHLWFFFYLDDFTPENGATWVVPGSHRVRSVFEPSLGKPWTAPDLDLFPSRVQLLGEAGDLVVVDARALHTSDRNATDRPRRMINLGLVHESRQRRIRTNHWAVAGPAIRERASKQLRRLLSADLPETRPGVPACVLPEGWRTGG